MKPEDVPPQKLLALAQLHVRHFENLLSSAAHGEPGIRVDECEEYLHTWKSIVRKAHGVGPSRPVVLIETEAQEVHDAIWSGEFDDLLGIEEDDEQAHL